MERTTVLLTRTSYRRLARAGPVFSALGDETRYAMYEELARSTAAMSASPSGGPPQTMPIEISAAFAPGLDTPDHIALAESLGYQSAWVAEGHGGDQFAILAAGGADVAISYRSSAHAAEVQRASNASGMVTAG